MSIAPRRAEILYVIGALEIGGAELHLARIAPEMARRGWAVSVYSLAGSGALRGAFERGGVNVIRPPFERDRGSRFLLNRMARMSAAAVHLLVTLIRRRPRIVHFFLPESYLIGAPLAAVARVPVRVMSRRSLNVYQRRMPLWRAAERVLHRGMTAVLANSGRVAGELAAEGVAADRLALIYNGIETARFAVPASRETVRAALDIAPSALVLVVVANLIPYKGHADLFEALALAAPHLPPGWRLLVVGRDDGIGDRLREQAGALSLQDHVRFLGLRDDVPALLAASDIGIIASHEEGFSNAVLEGMAAGLAMAVTAVGGNPEAVTDQASGLLVPAHDPPRLAQAIARLANEPALREQLGAAARRRVAERFALDRCVEDYDTFYRALCDGGRPPASLRAI